MNHYSKKAILFRTTLFFTILTLSLNGFTQSKADQIPELIIKSQSEVDSIAFYAFMDLALAYSYVNLDSSQFFLEKMKNIANEKYSKDPKKQARFYEVSGEIHREIGDLETAKEHTKKSLRTHLKYGALERVGYNYLQMGHHEADMYQYDSALVYLTKAKETFSKIQNSHGLAATIGNIGVIHSYLGNEAEAIKADYEILDIYLAEEKFTHVAVTLQNIGITLLDMDELEKAKDHFFQSIEYAEKENNQYRIAKSYGLLGDIAVIQEDYEEAFTLYKKDLAIREILGDPGKIYDSRMELSNAYITAEKWHEALKVLILNEGLLSDVNDVDHSLRIDLYATLALVYSKIGQNSRVLYYANSIDKLPIHSISDVINRLRIYNSLRDLYETTGKYKKALHYYQLRTHLKDSIYSAENKQNIFELQTKYETEKKEQEIASLQQAAKIQSLKFNSYLIGGASLVLLIIGGGFLSYRQYKIKKDKATLQLEQRFLRSQLNPHFIFNSMGAIQQYILTESPEKASDYMGVFSKLMRQILENSREEFIPVEEEVSMLKNYLELQKLRFKNTFKYVIELDESLDEAYDGIPPMFAQPFIENALEHGLFKKEKNEIKIKFLRTSDNLIRLEIEDSGTGITEKLIKAQNNQSLATKITRERLEKMRLTAKANLSFNTENITNDIGEIKGYKVSLNLPTKLIAA
ncbi:tetratricopeptide repeat-containing sensor histidine kinase [Ekhidna sp.]